MGGLEGCKGSWEALKNKNHLTFDAFIIAFKINYKDNFNLIFIRESLFAINMKGSSAFLLDANGKKVNLSEIIVKTGFSLYLKLFFVALVIVMK